MIWSLILNFSSDSWNFKDYISCSSCPSFFGSLFPWPATPALCFGPNSHAVGFLRPLLWHVEGGGCLWLDCSGGSYQTRWTRLSWSSRCFLGSLSYLLWQMSARYYRWAKCPYYSGSTRQIIFVISSLKRLQVRSQRDQNRINQPCHFPPLSSWGLLDNPWRLSQLQMHQTQESFRLICIRIESFHKLTHLGRPCWHWFRICKMVEEH